MTARSALVLDGSSGPALAVTRSLGRAGWRVVAPAGTRSALSRFASRAARVPDAADEPDAFVAALREELAREPVDVVVPCTDATVDLLWANEEILGGARILGADRRSYERVGDKAGALAAADASGFGTPRWEAPATAGEARAALERLGVPCVVKPRRSYVREGARLRHRRHSFVARASDLDRELALQAEPDGTLPVLEELVPGRALAVTAVVRDGRVLAHAARETLSFDPVAGGTSVWKRTVPPGDVGVAAALDLLRAVGYEGLAEVEYQVEEGAGGRERLMEIGVRIHGWAPLAMAAGVDLPLVAARALLGDELPDAPPYRVGVEMRWPAGELRRVRAALAPRAALPPGVSRADVLAKAWPPWRPGMRYDGIDLGDPAPWVPAVIRRRAARAAR